MIFEEAVQKNNEQTKIKIRKICITIKIVQRYELCQRRTKNKGEKKTNKQKNRKETFLIRFFLSSLFFLSLLLFFFCFLFFWTGKTSFHEVNTPKPCIHDDNWFWLWLKKKNEKRKKDIEIIIILKFSTELTHSYMYDNTRTRKRMAR